MTAHEVRPEWNLEEGRGPSGHHRTRWTCICGEHGPWRKSRSHAMDGGWWHLVHEDVTPRPNRISIRSL